MLSNQRAFGMDRTLTDGEWLELGDCILAINRSTTNESVRFQVLKYVLDIVPFHTAAFFVAHANRIDYGGAVIVQPIGTESLMGADCRNEGQRARWGCIVRVCRWANVGCRQFRAIDTMRVP